MLNNGPVGLAIAAALLTAALVLMVARRRRRVLAQRLEPNPGPSGLVADPSPAALNGRTTAGQGSMSSATARSTAAIFFASLGSGCLPRR